MPHKKIKYNPKTRNDISNPYNKYSHEELLRLANIQKFNGSYEIKQLDNGRIIVKAVQKKKREK